MTREQRVEQIREDLIAAGVEPNEAHDTAMILEASEIPAILCRNCGNALELDHGIFWAHKGSNPLTNLCDPKKEFSNENTAIPNDATLENAMPQWMKK